MKGELSSIQRWKSDYVDLVDILRKRDELTKELHPALYRTFLRIAEGDLKEGLVLGGAEKELREHLLKAAAAAKEALRENIRM